MNFISFENLENTQMEEIDFQFNCFSIMDSETLLHWHKHTEIIYIRKGICSVYVNGTVFSVEEGDIILVPQGSLHSILPHIPAEYFALVIGDTLFTDMFQDLHCEAALSPFLSKLPLAPFHLSYKHDLHSFPASIINEIIKEYTDKMDCYQLLIKVALCKFFSYLIRYFPNVLSTKFEVNHQRHNTQIIKQALAYLSENYKLKITIADMSSQYNISGQHFCRLFKSYTGKTFINYLTDIRLDNANRLLLKTDLPITRIPELVGFCNANYFARIYKNRYGHAPSHSRWKQFKTTDKQGF